MLVNQEKGSQKKKKKKDETLDGRVCRDRSIVGFQLGMEIPCLQYG